MSVEPNQSMEDQLRTQAETPTARGPGFRVGWRGAASTPGGGASGLSGRGGTVDRRELRMVLDASWPGGCRHRRGVVPQRATARSATIALSESTAVPSLELAALDDSAESREQPDREMDSRSSAPTIADRSLPAESLSVPLATKSADPSPGADRTRHRSDVGATPRAARPTAPPMPTAAPRAGERQLAAEPASMLPVAGTDRGHERVGHG